MKSSGKSFPPLPPFYFVTTSGSLLNPCWANFTLHPTSFHPQQGPHRGPALDSFPWWSRVVHPHEDSPNQSMNEDTMIEYARYNFVCTTDIGVNEFKINYTTYVLLSSLTTHMKHTEISFYHCIMIFTSITLNT